MATAFDTLRNLQSPTNFTGRMGAAGRDRAPMSAEIGGPDNYTENDITMDNVPEPFYGDSYESQANRRSVQAEDKQSIALDMLRRMSEEGRSQERLDTEAEDADFTAHGMDRAVQEGRVDDYTSEAKAGRGFLPNAAQAGERDFDRQMERTNAQYGNPAKIAGQNDVASIKATGDENRGVAAARAKADAVDPSLQGLYNAFEDFQKQNKRPVTEEEAARFRQLYRIQ